MEVYDPSTDAWTAGKGMSTNRWDFGLASLNNKLYVVGGSTRQHGAFSSLASMEVYDPSTDTWTAHLTRANHYCF